ncbi:DUF6461 domain-containing protein [Streptomyces sp. NPDC057249]|uniref:DUF6461 domain-containing protein n=1 Tax=Streptomyces sp. NPDC057249 TaxID=3346067 RepID=UPI0036342487
MTRDVPRAAQRPDPAKWQEAVARYAWADADEWALTFTFSVIAGKTEDEVIRAFGGDPGASRLMTWDEAADEQAHHLYEDHPLLGVVTAGRHVIALEPGYHGCVPEIARRASADGGEFFSVHADVNARYEVTHALNGRVDGAFDPFVLEDAAWMDPKPDVPVWAEGIEFHMETVCAESLALMEHTMGASIDPAWLTTPLRTVLLTPVSELFGRSDAAWLP